MAPTELAVLTVTRRAWSTRFPEPADASTSRRPATAHRTLAEIDALHVDDEWSRCSMRCVGSRRAPEARRCTRPGMQPRDRDAHSGGPSPRTRRSASRRRAGVDARGIRSTRRLTRRSACPQTPRGPQELSRGPRQGSSRRARVGPGGVGSLLDHGPAVVAFARTRATIAMSPQLEPLAVPPVGSHVPLPNCELRKKMGIWKNLLV